MIISKNACINWHDLDEILAHRFSLMEILSMHPKIYDEVLGTKTTPKTFAETEKHFRATPRDLLNDWRARDLYLLRAERWCRQCKATGHTLPACPGKADEKVQPVAEDIKETQKETEGSAAYHGDLVGSKTETHRGKKRTTRKVKPQAKRARRFLKDYNYDSFLYEIERDRDGLCRMRMDAFHEGEISQVEPEEHRNRGGFITAPAMQRSLWFSIAGNQIGFGLKRVQPGEKVWFRLKQNEEKHFCAVQVSPVDQTLDETDIGRFLRMCESTVDPCTTMGLILASSKQWTRVVQFIRPRKEARHLLSHLLKFIAHVSVLASSSIIDKTEAEWLKAAARGKSTKDAPVYKPAFLLSNEVVKAYAVYFMQAVFQLGQERPLMPGLSVQTSPDSLFEIIREMIFQDLAAHKAETAALSDAGSPYFPPESSGPVTAACSLGNGEIVLLLKVLLGFSVLTRLTPQTKGLVTYTMQLIGRSMGARKDAKEVNMFIPLLQSIHLALSCVDRLRVSSFHAVIGSSAHDAALPPRVLQSASNSIALRAEELNFAVADARSPFHAQNIADLSKKQHNLYDHFHAHYITLRAEFYLQLVRVMRSCLIGDKVQEQVREDFGEGASSHAKDSEAEVPQKDLFASDVVRGVRLAGLYMDHNNSLCPLISFYRNGVRFNHEAFTSGALLTISTAISENESQQKYFDASELFALSVVDSLSIGDEMIVCVRAVNDNFPYKRFFECLRRNEASLARKDEVADPNQQTHLFVQQSFFPAFEPVLGKIHEFLRLPFTRVPFPYLFGGNEPRRSTLIPNGYRKAFDYIIKSLHERYELDSGQSEVMHALKSEPVLLVQGPPGTGKSFVGTRIVEAFTDFRIQLRKQMLSNLYEVGDTIEDGTPRIGPILILTFKNHALDEFLKDILTTGLWCDGARGHDACACTGDHRGCCPKCCRHDKRVVRIGTRICDQTLLQHTLGELMVNAEKQQPYIDSLKRFSVIKERIRSIFSSLSAMKAGSIPTGLFLKYLTATQRDSFTDGCAAIAESLDAKESLIDPYCNDILVNTGTVLDFQRWLQGEDNKASIDPAVADVLTKEALEARIAAFGDAFRGEIRAKLFQKDILALQPDSTGMEGAAEHQPGDAAKQVSEQDLDSRWSAFVDGNPDATAGESFFENAYAFDTTGFTFDFHAILNEDRDLSNEAIDAPKLSVICPWVLSADERYEFVASIIAHEVQAKAAELGVLANEYKHLRAFTKRARQEDEVSILRRADVIAATSTGCTMHIELIKQIAPSVLIVEEAAEMLEAHLLSCLTPSMKQIILIGDHQQLRPRIDNYDLIANHHINISLFERLATEKYPLILLNNQRRMQREIADLIRPFYAREGYALEDHESVRGRALSTTSGRSFNAPPGFPAKVCFWDHDHPEEKLAHGHSLTNAAEIAMAVYLVNFSLYQGVPPSSITIITPYAAQRRELINALRRHRAIDSCQIAVTTVDRFQGDENDVIILSLVRTRNLTDFLQLENRMIVSCSRARHQLVVLGSKKLLAKCAHWRTVLGILGNANVHRSLPLFCTMHPKKIHKVTSSAVLAAYEKANASGARMRPFECRERCTLEKCDRNRCPGTCHMPFGEKHS